MQNMDVADALQSKRKDMMFYDDRLATFKFWPNQLKPDKYELARNGFYYTGQFDKVTCFCCNLSVYAWEQTDDPFQEHLRMSSSCGFLKMVGSGKVNVQSDDERRKFPTFEKKSHTSGFDFASSIPSNVFVKQTPTSSFGGLYSK